MRPPRCRINRGAYVELTNEGVVRACLAQQNNKFKKFKHYKNCDTCCIGKVIKVEGLDCDVTKLELPHNMVLMPEGKLKKLTREYEKLKVTQLTI